MLCTVLCFDEALFITWRRPLKECWPEQAAFYKKNNSFGYFHIKYVWLQADFTNSLFVCRGLYRLATVFSLSWALGVSLHVSAKVRVHSKTGNGAFQLRCIWLYGIENWKIKAIGSRSGWLDVSQLIRKSHAVNRFTKMYCLPSGYSGKWGGGRGWNIMFASVTPKCALTFVE